MKNPLCYLVVCILALNSLAYGAPVTLPPADIYYTSFESTETPSYSTGNIGGQNGWEASGGGLNAQVATSGDGGLTPPVGSQMLRQYTGNTDTTTQVQLTFTSPALNSPFSFSVLGAFTGDGLRANNMVFTITLANTSAQWNGVQIGIQNDAGTLRFFYTDEVSEGTFGRVSFGSINPTAATFYQFYLDVDVPNKAYSVSIFDFTSGDLLASANNIGFRNNTPNTIDFLRFQTGGYDSSDSHRLKSYFDEVWISSTPIPETSSLHLLLGAALSMILVPFVRQHRIKKKA